GGFVGLGCGGVLVCLGCGWVLCFCLGFVLFLCGLVGVLGVGLWFFFWCGVGFGLWWVVVFWFVGGVWGVVGFFSVGGAVF
ncbi:hypothetical protein, partial [Acinetobacter baumannii]|uniref:hypothetical protein n=1 Tax=Acinetobacter baumannii TaxID=470 RepID=UPI00148E8B7F